MIKPLLREPPSWPLPDPSETSAWYGELWVKYPLCHSLAPQYYGHVFKSRSEFRIIMNEFCHAAYSPTSTITYEKATELRSRMEIWFAKLPEQLSPKYIVLPGHLQLQ